MQLLPTPQDLLNKITGGLPGGSPSALATPVVKKLTSPSLTLPSPEEVLSSSKQGSSQPSFASNLFDSAKKIVSKIPDVLRQAGTAVSTALDPTKPLSPSELLDVVKGSTSDLGSAIHSISDGFNEGVARIAKSTISRIAGPEITQQIANSPLGQFGKIATGRQNTIEAPGIAAPEKTGQPLTTYQDIYHNVQGYALDNNASIPEARTFAGIAVMGAMFADNPIIGPEEKSLFKLSDYAIQALKKETDETAIRVILQKENPWLQEKETDALAPIFKNAGSDTEVKIVADQLAAAQRAGIKNALAGTLPSPEEVASKATVVPPEQPKTAQAIENAYYDQVISKKTADEPIVIAGDDIKKYFGRDYDPERSDMYAQAAYKNVNRVIDENPGRPFTFLAGGPGSGKTELLGKHITDDEGYKGILYETSLSNYNGVKNIIERARAAGSPIKIRGIIADIDKARKFTIDRAEQTGREVTDEAFARGHAGAPAVVKKLLEDGIVTPNEVELYDLRNVKDLKGSMQRIKLGISAKNPLDLLKKVQYDENTLLARVKENSYGKGQREVSAARGADSEILGGNETDRGSEIVGRTAESGGGEDVAGGTEGTVNSREFQKTLPMNVNLVRDIAREETPGAVRDILRSSFSNLSDAALTPIANRLAKLKNGRDIEGILKIVRNVDKDIADGRPSIEAANPENAVKLGENELLSPSLG